MAERSGDTALGHHGGNRITEALRSPSPARIKIFLKSPLYPKAASPFRARASPSTLPPALQNGGIRRIGIAGAGHSSWLVSCCLQGKLPRPAALHDADTLVNGLGKVIRTWCAVAMLPPWNISLTARHTPPVQSVSPRQAIPKRQRRFALLYALHITTVARKPSCRATPIASPFALWTAVAKQRDATALRQSLP